MTLVTEFVVAYCAARDIKPDSGEQLKHAAISFGKHLCRAATLDDFQSTKIDAWIVARLAAGKARKTVAGQRAAILTLWKEAHRLGLARPVERVRLVKVQAANPPTWWPSEFDKLLASISLARGAFACGVPRALLLRALAMVAYYSGLRPEDLLSLRSSDVLAAGRLIVRQDKTGELIDVTLPPDAMALILATQPENRDRVFPFTYKALWYWINKLTAQAGIPGSSKWFRRLGATRCEQEQPGSAMAFLGHKTPGLAYKHYVDRRQIQGKRPLPPPPLGETG